MSKLNTFQTNMTQVCFKKILLFILKALMAFNSCQNTVCTDIQKLLWLLHYPICIYRRVKLIKLRHRNMIYPDGRWTGSGRPHSKLSAPGFNKARCRHDITTRPTQTVSRWQLSRAAVVCWCQTNVTCQICKLRITVLQMTKSLA